MRIIFEKLKTSNENIYVDFGDGVWTEHSVESARTSGINIPDTCEDYTKIKIKGGTNVFSNLNVLTGIKGYKNGIDDISVDWHLNEQTDKIEGSIIDCGLSSVTEALPLYVNTDYQQDDSDYLSEGLEDIRYALDSYDFNYQYVIDIGSDQVIRLSSSEENIIINALKGSIFNWNEGDATVEIDGYTYNISEDNPKKLKDNLSFGEVLIQFSSDGEGIIDTKSEGIKGFIDEFGENALTQLDSSPQRYMKVGTTDKLNGKTTDVYERTEDFLSGKYLYIHNSSSGAYYKTNFRL